MQELTCDICKAGLAGKEHVTLFQDGQETGHWCMICSYEQSLQHYRDSGELRSSLATHALLHHLWFTEQGQPTKNRSLEMIAHYKRYWKALQSVHRDMEEIRVAARSMPQAIARLRAYYRSTDKRCHSGTRDGMRALLWGCAGRVLLTLQDEKSADDPQAKFGGANVTLIFSEDGLDEPGVQSLAATRDEALALLATAREAMPNLAPDGGVCVA